MMNAHLPSKALPLRPMDKTLLLVTLILIFFGVVMIFSASQFIAERQRDNTFHFLFQQLIRVGIGLGALVFAAKYDYHNYINKAMPILLFTAVLLVFVLGMSKVKGASRWLGVQGMGIQPSELAKIGVLLYLSAYLARKGDRVRNFKKGVLPPLVITGIFSFLIVLQPHYSTAALLMLMGIIILFVGGMRVIHLLMIAGLMIPIGILAAIASPYRVARLMTFLNPHTDALGMGYQIKQSLISFGNGGLLGTGIGSGKQKLFFLPEPYTDFIYSIIGEELGLLGATAVLVLFGVILYRAVRIARLSCDMYGFYLASGIIVSIVFYALLNAAVTVGLLPTTGQPMPFISYGGSSMVFACFSMGVLLNISTQTVDDKNKAMANVHEVKEDEETFNEAMNVFPDEPLVRKATSKPGYAGKDEPPVSGGNLVGMDFS